MKRSMLILLVFLVLISTGCKTGVKTSTDRYIAFDSGWKFIRDSIKGAEAPGYNDSSWRTIDLPHDFSMEKIDDSVKAEHIGPFTRKSEGGAATGHVKGGTAWYRKHFRVDETYEHKTVTLCFDGVYMIANIWVNGKKAGDHFYGYTPFSFDITSLLQKNTNNTVAVEVKNPGKNSRWYSGSGIYRHVWLTVTNPQHIEENGVFITTSSLAKDSANLQLSIALINGTAESFTGQLITTITDPEGKQAGRKISDIQVGSKGRKSVEESLAVLSPELWSVESPSLYTATFELVSGNETKDSYSVKFGIRTISVSAKDGLLLNGQAVKLKGACMHHDNGLLGSATFDRAEERRVEIMKRNGYNAIRTSHNPPSRQFLDACDRLGMLVIDEAFDMWEHPKNPSDYSLFFKDHWKGDLESMILRDRNHPGVIFWSIGNEIYERADTSGERIAKQLVATIESLDKTRPITQAVCGFWDHPGRKWEATAPAFAHLGVGGYNYAWQEYENDHKKFPERIMMGTESFPFEAFENWAMVEKDPWVIGDFVWTGMDYLGESGIGHVYFDKNDFNKPWPWYNAWCGDIDILGEKKAQSYYRDVVWKRSHLEMAVHSPVPEGMKENISGWGWPDEYQSWSWPGIEGKVLQVSVYSDCQEVKLELNGKVIGQKPVTDKTKLTARFMVPYAPGELKATGITNGKAVASKSFKTTGEPASLRLVADRSKISANRNDLAYVKILVTDTSGNVVTWASNRIKLTVTGAGELIASGNASPDDMVSFRNPDCKPYNGICMAIIRPFNKPGTITLKAESEGMPATSVMISAE